MCCSLHSPAVHQFETGTLGSQITCPHLASEVKTRREGDVAPQLLSRSCLSGGFFSSGSVRNGLGPGCNVVVWVFGPDMTRGERGGDGAEGEGCLAFSARLLALTAMSVS